MGCRQSKDKEEKKEGDAAAAEGQDAGAEGEPKLIVVFGATGQQGGAVVEALKGDNTFKIRAVTRDPESEKGKALAEIEGVEVVKADLGDPDSLKVALQGAYAVFGVTTEQEDKDTEIQHGKNLVDAAKEAEVKHLVFSGLPNATEAGKPVSFFDSKAAVEDYIKEKEVPHTFVHLAFYYENLLGISKPQKNEDGNFVLDIPMGDAALGMVSVAGAGECIHQILKQLDEYKDKTVGLVAQKLKVDEYAAILTKGLTDRKVEAGTITTEEFAKKDIPNAAEYAAMFDLLQTDKVEFDIELTRKLNPDMPAFENWVDSNKEELEKVLV